MPHKIITSEETPSKHQTPTCICKRMLSCAKLDIVSELSQDASSATCHSSYHSIQHQSNSALLVQSQHERAGTDELLTSCLLPSYLSETLLCLCKIPFNPPPPPPWSVSVCLVHTHRLASALLSFMRLMFPLQK